MPSELAPMSILFLGWVVLRLSSPGRAKRGDSGGLESPSRTARGPADALERRRKNVGVLCAFSPRQFRSAWWCKLACGLATRRKKRVLKEAAQRFEPDSVPTADR